MFDEAQKYISENHEQVTDLLADFSQTDVLLFYCPRPEIRKLQEQKWQPILDLCNQNLNTVFKATDALEVLPQNKNSAEVFKKMLKTLSLKQLTVLYLAATNLKSPLLGYLLLGQKISAAQAFDLAYLEELCQNERWGEDAEAVEKRRKVFEVLQQIEDYIKND